MNRPTIYIAGRSTDLERAKAAMYGAVQVGFRVLCDWTAAIEEEAAKGKSDRDLSPQDCLRYASIDFQAAVQASVFWLLIPQQSKAGGVGAWIEYGAALMSARVRNAHFGQQLVVCSGTLDEPPMFSIFFELAHQRFKSDEDALKWLATIPVGRAVSLELEQRNARGFEWAQAHPALEADSE